MRQNQAECWFIGLGHRGVGAVRLCFTNSAEEEWHYVLEEGRIIHEPTEPAVAEEGGPLPSVRAGESEPQAGC